MKYKITHLTTYQYAETVPICQNLVHLTPRDAPNQTCTYHRLKIDPLPATLGKRLDYFGNPASIFSITQGHRKLAVTAVSQVNMHPGPSPNPAQSPPWEAVRDSFATSLASEDLDAYQFTFDSPLATGGPELDEYARQSFSPGRPVLEAAMELTGRIHTDFQYDPGATTVHTPVAEVFARRRGVCQDLAHVAIASLRRLRLAARYVSGYLRTEAVDGEPKLVGSDASHAWLAIYCGPLGWVDLDPTNNVAASADHITVAWGRDYSDVCPIHGIYTGGGQQSISVAVSVVHV